jgi:cell division protein FtsB
MKMEFQNIVDTVLLIISGLIGWFAKELWSVLKELKEDLSSLKEDLPRSYVLREDYKQDIKDLKEIMGKIFDKLDNKLDR